MGPVGSPSRDAGFRLFECLDGISSTLPYYHSPKHTFQSVNFPTKYGGFFDICLSTRGGYSHPIHMLKSMKKIKKLKAVGVVFLPAPFDHSSMSF